MAISEEAKKELATRFRYGICCSYTCRSAVFAWMNGDELLQPVQGDVQPKAGRGKKKYFSERSFNSNLQEVASRRIFNGEGKKVLTVGREIALLNDCV